MIIVSEYDKQALRVTVMDRGGSGGMDMALSTSLIDAHRGRIRAEPNMNGATVQLTPPSRQAVVPR